MRSFRAITFILFLFFYPIGLNNPTCFFIFYIAVLFKWSNLDRLNCVHQKRYYADPRCGAVLKQITALCMDFFYLINLFELNDERLEEMHNHAKKGRCYGRITIKVSTCSSSTQSSNFKSNAQIITCDISEFVRSERKKKWMTCLKSKVSIFFCRSVEFRNRCKVKENQYCETITTIHWLWRCYAIESSSFVGLVSRTINLFFLFFSFQIRFSSVEI